MARPEFKRPSEETILKAIKGSRGIVNTAAKKLKVDWSTANKWIQSSPVTKKAMFDEGETMLDIAENALFKNAQNGDNQAIKFYLATKGKKRGYVESQQIENTIKTDKPIQINYNVIKDKK